MRGYRKGSQDLRVTLKTLSGKRRKRDSPDIANLSAWELKQLRDLLELAKALGNVRLACKRLGVSAGYYYKWRESIQESRTKKPR